MISIYRYDTRVPESRERVNIFFFHAPFQKHPNAIEREVGHTERRSTVRRMQSHFLLAFTNRVFSQVSNQVQGLPRDVPKFIETRPV